MIPQWQRANLIVDLMVELDRRGEQIEDHRYEITKTVEEQYEYCHGCLLLAVYGFYKNGLIDKHTKIEIKVIYDKGKGKFLRTQTDSNENKNLVDVPTYFKNNLLELPIYYYDNEKDKWYRCQI